MPAGAGHFSLHHCVQTGSGAHPAFYPMGTRSSFLGVKQPGREDDYTPLSRAVKNAWSHISTPPIHLHGVVLNLPPRDNFTLCFYVSTRFLIQNDIKPLKKAVVIYVWLQSHRFSYNDFYTIRNECADTPGRSSHKVTTMATSAASRIT
jgi:hypothetical protein